MKHNTSRKHDNWPHRFDPIRNEIHYIKATREDHRAAVFLTDEYLKGTAEPHRVSRQDIVLSDISAPLHFIFHSGYCCSTLLAKAFDIPGKAMGLKEPVILNDLVGWKARGAEDQPFKLALADILTLLSEPFDTNETVIAKPSSLLNVLAPQILDIRRDSKALVLYAPLAEFLGSIARKGLMGRLWVRELMSKQLRDGMINLGLAGDDYIRLTDLQAAAVCWLSQQALFAALKFRFGSERVISLDSAALLKSPKTKFAKISHHFDIKLSENSLNSIVNGPVFASHSKTNVSFDTQSRESNRLAGQKLHADEIEKVLAWATIVAKNAHIPLTLP